MTSATLADPTLEDPFALAEMRTGAARLPDRPKTLRLASPFDYAAQTRCFVVTDVNTREIGALAAARDGSDATTHTEQVRERIEAMIRDTREGGLYQNEWGVWQRGTGKYAEQIGRAHV